MIIENTLKERGERYGDFIENTLKERGERYGDSIENTLKERGERYGDFTDHAAIAQELQDVMRGTPGWERLTPVQKQALTVIADKQARILSGDPNYTDNWHDIQGYAKLAEDRCIDTSAVGQGELPLDPVEEATMPEIDKYLVQSPYQAHTGYTRLNGKCAHGVVLGGYCGECARYRRPVAAELDPSDGA